MKFHTACELCDGEEDFFQRKIMDVLDDYLSVLLRLCTWPTKLSNIVPHWFTPTRRTWKRNAGTTSGQPCKKVNIIDHNRATFSLMLKSWSIGSHAWTRNYNSFYCCLISNNLKYLSNPQFLRASTVPRSFRETMSCSSFSLSCQVIVILIQSNL